MKPKPREPERDPQQQMRDFEAQPPAKQELQRLNETVEKSTGPERVAADRKVKEKATGEKSGAGMGGT